ncbi:hypothetical protein NPIL_98581 [Nephila pilipes]|uniref:Uncharacterized protein n=1 Tax=Nephila pilipes TaxID=299642 RepID=A0A8X6SZJ2_NEPPI|nr:hypothetical protein NPIL_98581 [Nephila pilipes]
MDLSKSNRFENVDHQCYASPVTQLFQKLLDSSYDVKFISWYIFCLQIIFFGIFKKIPIILQWGTLSCLSKSSLKNNVEIMIDLTTCYHKCIFPMHLI